MKTTESLLTTRIHRLLLVDDDPINLALLCAYFDETDYQITQAKDGVEALDIIQSHASDYFSAYLLDYRMPNKDGITLLQELKSDIRYEMVPAILQTSASSHEDINRGIQAGAFYYLLKPFSKTHLLSIVEAAVKGFTNHQQIINRTYSLTESAQLLQSGHFTFKTIEQAKNLSNFLANLTPKPNKVAIGLFELLVNAVEHGNLEIGYQEKTKLIHHDLLQTEIQKRLKRVPYNERHVDVLIERLNRTLLITITDMGQGFDSQPYLDFSMERAMDNHGRGIMMASKLSFDELRYSEKGNVAYCTINLD